MQGYNFTHYQHDTRQGVLSGMCLYGVRACTHRGYLL